MVFEKTKMTKRICSYTIKYTIELCLHSAVNYAGCVTVFIVDSEKLFPNMSHMLQ